MDITTLEKEIISTAREFYFVRNITTVDKTRNTIKIQLSVTHNCFIQIYVNIKKKLKNYVVILNEDRFYGRNCDGRKWHRHPFTDPSKHDFSKEGIREVTLEEFLFETAQILKKKNLI